MSQGRDIIKVGGSIIREGTSVYDTEYDRVLWITEIGEHGIMIECVDGYDVEETNGWTPSSQGNRIEDGTMFGIQEFKSLVAADRFEISP